jgi:hypothetical protein
MIAICQIREWFMQFVQTRRQFLATASFDWRLLHELRRELKT